ncbi:hypothetical protein D9757_002165 [Collybiopsis confluens]|uniref:Uncharacterized protein n=1 Tax=Collybiopsis confluens TaxID=2823264 RepID=A0A8H5HZU8_9AGAR|nr:hypothetical protein D9757_002165 [Collybiopsis confluens]
MNHPYSGAASYIYANEHDRDDISEAGVYASLKGFVPYRYENTHSPSTTETHLPNSFPPSAMSSPTSMSAPLSSPSARRKTRWSTVQSSIVPSSLGRNDSRTRSSPTNGHSTRPSSGRAAYNDEPPSSQPMASFVDFRDLQSLERREQTRAKRWWQIRIQNAFHILRRLWARDS